MKDEYLVYGIVLLAIVCFAFAWHVADSYTYENVTGNITGKWENEYTSMVAYSNGKTSWLIPVTHHDYWLNTTYGEVKASKGTYDNFTIGDKVNLTRIVNTTDIYLR